nr:aldehyde dehydrogenase family protein [Candidatus Dormibacteraeota bacterium]
MTAERLDVRKTYKLYVGGQFVRSESGRAYSAEAYNVPRASRKDVRDAVRSARTAFGGWAGRTAMNRGQILYRIAEMLDGRRAQFLD